LRFPAGSIYWVRDDVLKALADLRLSAEDFEPEQALVDGTTAHAVERLMGWLALSAGRRLLPASALDPSAVAGGN
jgi:lipopolysaccharide biosynthesis protein